jgi:uncharacterized protein (TIGR03435 family)
VQQLSSQFGLPVQDKTGLTGSYDFTLEWSPEIQSATLGDDPQNTSQPDEVAQAGASLSTALEEQLGLRLDVQKGPVEMLMIDQVERPTEN